MPWASIAGALLGPVAGLFGIGAPAQQSASTSTASVTYSAPPPDGSSSFNWQGAASQWEAIGVTLIVLLLLGSFAPTRPLAIAIAVLLGAVLILGKVNA